MKKYVLVFSGQGSERVGMFRDIIKESTRLEQVLDFFNEQLGVDLEEAITTKDAQIVAKNNQLLLCIYHHLMSELVVDKIGYNPAFTMGHSFGQFSALASSGAVSFRDIARFVNKRIEIINDPKIEVKASFKSIHGLTLEAFEEFRQVEELEEDVELALHNQREQVVCGVTPNGMEKLEELTDKYKYMLKDIHVSRPYHTRFMEKYNEKLIPFIEDIQFFEAKVPVVPNHLKEGVKDGEKLKAETKIQMIKPVYWYESVLNVSKEVDAFVIIDPSETQFKILRRITNKKIHNVNNLGMVKMMEKKGV